MARASISANTSSPSGQRSEAGWGFGDRRAIEALGEQGVVDLVGVCGYYMLVSMTLNVFEMPLPAGVPDPLA